MSTVVEIDDLSLRFLLRHNSASALKVRFLGMFHRNLREQLVEFWAVKDISLRISEGEAIGLIGRNGSGKSTLLKLLSGIYRPTVGRVRVARNARIGTMIELGVGFHWELTASENVFLNAAIHGLSRQEIEAIYKPVVEYSGLGHFMDTPLKNLSSGMRLRLGFAVMAHLDPDIMLLDEIFAVGDEDFQKQCMKTIHRFQQMGKTIVFVSHSPDAVRAICHRACVLDAGELIYDGDIEGGLNRYQRLLLSSGPGQPVRGEDRNLPARRAKERTVRPAPELTEEALDTAWHRVVVGGLWNELADLQFEFMKAQGLRPEHFVLDVGCGSLRGGTRFIPYVSPGHYYGLDSNGELIASGIEIELARKGVDPGRAEFIVNDSFDLSAAPPRFDYALAQELFTQLSLNAVVRCVSMVVRKLQPHGRFYVSYYENPEAENFRPIVHPSGITTYPDAYPYHYDFEALARAAEAVGARAERIGGWGHPRDLMMMVITPAASSGAPPVLSG